MVKKLKYIAKFLVFIILLAVIVLVTSNILERKYSIQKNKVFFDEEMNYDVFFMGTSHVVYGVSPLELYKSYGITSYNLANYSSYMAVTYWTLLNAMNYHTPKLVVVDLYCLYQDKKFSPNIDFAHNTFDAYPLTYTKYNAVKDLFVDSDDKLEMLFPFVKYHSRWNEITSEDFAKSGKYTAGFEIYTKVFAYAKDTDIPDKDVLPDDYTVSMIYLEKIIEYCNERNIEILLCNIPYLGQTERQVYNNYGYVMSEKYDINYIDLAKCEDLINYDTDFYDKSGHLNVSGAVKVTGELGRYIKEHYNIVDTRTTDDAGAWNDYYELYLKSYVADMQAKNSADDYLMMLNNVNLEADIYLNCDVTRENEPLLFKLIDNLNGDILKKVDENWESEDADIRIVVRRKDTGELVGEKSFSFS